MGFDEHGQTGDEYDLFDALGFDAYDSQRQAWIDWQRAMEVRLDLTPKTGRSWGRGSRPTRMVLDEIADWETFGEAARPHARRPGAWMAPWNRAWWPSGYPEVDRVAARYAGPYRAADVEPDWTTWLPPFDFAVRGKNTITWHERDGIWLNARDAAHYDAIMASARANYEAERTGTWVQPKD